MTVVPITLRTANAFVMAHHRHHRPVPGAKFSVGLMVGGELAGVAIAGRPVARMEDQALTIEVNRLCTNGEKNACSKLYAAVTRAAAGMGYTRAITYTLPSEGGVSLKASGWKLVGEAGGGPWSRPSRGRKDEHPTEVKWKWEKSL